MGPMLTKPVTTRILERESTPHFHIGVSYMNGYRDKMEDAHTVYPKDGWGFFGVFDGHCGPKCSEYVAKRFIERLEGEQVPISDETLRDISLEVDTEFLQSKEEGGSTGTFMTAQRKGAKYVIQVGNVGDSRVVLGRRAKRVTVSMTEDHKPTLPHERERILNANGTVSNCRVDGSLAVSRAFGDAQYKNLGIHDSKVIAVPEFTHEECEEGDVVLLCCDGVFESGVFENNTVMEYIFDKLEQKMDLALIAAEVCTEAMLRGSKDNISAMIVQLGGELDCKDKHPHKEILAGPYSCPGNEKFALAYEAMAEKGGLTVPQCVDLRHHQAVALLEQLKAATKCQGKTCDYSTLGRTDLQRLASKAMEECDVTATDAQLVNALKEMEVRHKDDESLDLRPVDIQDMEMELTSVALPKNLTEQPHGSAERVAWFENWISQARGAESDASENEELLQRVKEIQQQVGLPPQLLMSLLRARGGP